MTIRDQRWAIEGAAAASIRALARAGDEANSKRLLRKLEACPPTRSLRQVPE